MQWPLALLVALTLILLSVIDAGSITDELPPVLQRLSYEGDVDPTVIHNFEIHIDMNRANYEPDGPPSLPLRASALLCSEFLALVYPPQERSLNNPLATISPSCEDALGGGTSCRLDEYVVFDGELQFSYLLTYGEFSLTGIESPEELEKDDMGYPPPNKGASIQLRIDVLDRRERGREALEGIVGIVSEMFGAKGPTTSIDDLKQRGGHEEAKEEVIDIQESNRRGGDEL